MARDVTWCCRKSKNTEMFKCICASCKLEISDATNKALQARVEKLEGTLSCFANCDDPNIECKMDSIEAENYVSLWFTAVNESRKALAPSEGKL